VLLGYFSGFGVIREDEKPGVDNEAAAILG
jgi:hypothetical protein